MDDVCEIKLTLLKPDEEISADSKVNVSIKFIRDTLEPDADGYVKCMQDCFKGEAVSVSYVCDVCDTEYPTLNDMNSNKCEHCTKYFDYCKIHEPVTQCPFCKLWY